MILLPSELLYSIETQDRAAIDNVHEKEFAFVRHVRHLFQTIEGKNDESTTVLPMIGRGVFERSFG